MIFGAYVEFWTSDFEALGKRPPNFVGTEDECREYADRVRAHLGPCVLGNLYAVYVEEIDGGDA